MIVIPFQSPPKKLNYPVSITQSQIRKLKPLKVFKAEGNYYSKLVTRDMEEAEKTTREWKVSQILATAESS